MGNRHLHWSILLSLLLAGGGLVQAATITVTANAPDVLNGADASCSLREAITNVNNSANTFADCANTGAAYGTGDTINLPAGTYTNTIAGINENLNATGDLDIQKNVAIIGAGQSSTFIDGGAIDRVLQIGGGLTDVSISGVTIQNGLTTLAGGLGDGGGIHSGAILTITASTIRNNSASLSGGGGILSQGGSVTLLNSIVSNNFGKNVGAIDMENGVPLTITDSTISGNTTMNQIAGIYLGASIPSAVIISNSTISGNIGVGGTAITGGIHLGLGTLDITNSTITDNAGALASGIYSDGVATLKNTIVAGNTAGPECKLGAAPGTVVNGGNNIDDGTSCGWTNLNGSMSSTNPLLGPLALNAPGTTQTHALLAGSPAINGVTFSAPNGAPATDQRGIARPQGAAYDIGAYEFIAGIVNGVCGSDNGTIVTSVPVNLCSAGAGSVPVYNNSTYDWSCTGSGGGSNAVCSATIHYLVTTGVSGANGTISANQTVAYHATPSFTLAPALGFVPGAITGSCGGTLVGNIFTVDPIVDVCTVTASFIPAVGPTAPTITSGALPAGMLGTPYNFTMTATGTGPITFSVTSGFLPTGLTLSTAGVITGTPTAGSIGPWTGTITAANGTLPDATQSFSIMIPLAGPPLVGATPVPTMSQWALVLLAGLLGLMGLAAGRRQRVCAAR